MSYTPILLERLVSRAAAEGYRGHMPGHKGKPLLPQPIERIDFTELSDTGNLYDPDSDNIIRQAESLVAQELHASDCLYCAGGSTLLIQASLAAVAQSADRPPRVLAARDAHRSFFHALSLLGGEADFLYPETREGLAVGVDPCQLREAIAAGDFDCVYLTAPSYYGCTCRAAELASVCAQMGIPLIIDAAHGAHLALSRTVKPGEDFGDAVAVFSAHKTLESMGGAAFALTSGGFFTKEKLLRGMELFGSSSPSYAVLASLDLGISRALSAEGRRQLKRVADTADEICEILQKHGVFLPDFAKNRKNGGLDPCRLTVGFPQLRGYDAARWLERELGIAAEMADERWVVFILTAADSEGDLRRLRDGLIACKDRCVGTVPPSHDALVPPPAERVISLRDALFAEKQTLRLGDAAGMIAGEVLAPYPPGIPVVAPGEKISQKTLSFLAGKWYNMDKKVRVIPLHNQRQEETQ